LHDNPHTNDGAPKGYTVSASDLVCDGSSNERAEQCPDGQQSHDETGAHIREVIRAVRVPLTKAAHEVAHSEEARNLARILYVNSRISLCNMEDPRLRAYIAEDTAACSG
jgi:hypothetical protein